MYTITYPTTLAASDDGRNLRYEDYVSRSTDREGAIKLMMALVKKNIPYTITGEGDRPVEADEIIPRQEFWEKYFASGLTHEAATEILLRRKGERSV